MSSAAPSSDQNGQKKQKSGKKKGLKFPFSKSKKPKESHDIDDHFTTTSLAESSQEASTSRAGHVHIHEDEQYDPEHGPASPRPFGGSEEQSVDETSPRSAGMDRGYSRPSFTRKGRKAALSTGQETTRRATVDFEDPEDLSSTPDEPLRPLVGSYPRPLHEEGSDDQEEHPQPTRGRDPTPKLKVQKRHTLETASAASGRPHASSSPAYPRSSNQHTSYDTNTASSPSSHGSASPLTSGGVLSSSSHHSPVSPRHQPPGNTSRAPGAGVTSSIRSGSSQEQEDDDYSRDLQPPIPTSSYVVHSDQSHGKLVKFFGDTHAVEDFDKVEFAPQPRHVKEMKLRQKFGGAVPFSHVNDDSASSSQQSRPNGSHSKLYRSHSALPQTGEDSVSSPSFGRSSSHSRLHVDDFDEESESELQIRSREAKTTTKIQKFFGQHFNLSHEPSALQATFSHDGSSKGSPGSAHLPLSHSSEESQEYAGPSAQPLTVDVAKLYKFFGQRVDIVKTADKQSRSNSTAASTVPTPPVVGHETPREPTFLIPVPDTSRPIRKSSSFTKSSSSLSKSSSSISKSPSFRDDQVIVTSLERSRGSGSGEGKEPNGATVGGSASNTADSLPLRDTYDDPSSGGLEHDELSPDNPSNGTKKSPSKGGLPVTIHAPNPKFSPPIVNGPTPPPEKRRSSSSRRLSQGSHSSSGSYSVPKAASSPSFSLPLGRVRRRSSQKSANSAHSPEVGDILSSGLSSAVYALTSRLAQLAALADVDPGGEHLAIPPPDDNLQEDLNALGNDHINGDEGDSEGDSEGDDRKDSEDEEFIHDSDPAVTLFADTGASGTNLDVISEPKPKTLSVTSPHYRKASSFRVRLERMDSSSPPDSPTSPTSPGTQQQQQRTIRKKSPFRQRGVSPYGTAPSKMMMTELEAQHATLHEDTEEERREKIREVQQAKKLRRMLGENVSVGEHNNAGLQIAPQVGTVNWKKLNRHFGVGVVESSSTPSSGSAISIQPSSRFSLVPMMDDIPEVHSSETDASSLRGSREHHVATTDESEEHNDLQISESISDDEGSKLNDKEEPKEHSKKRRDTADDSSVEHIQADSKPNVDPSVTDSFTT